MQLRFECTLQEIMGVEAELAAMNRFIEIINLLQKQQSPPIINPQKVLVCISDQHGNINLCENS